MSSTTVESTPSRRGADAQRSGNGSSSGPGPSFLRVLNSEFIKFRTLLSTLILLGSTVVVMVGFGAPGSRPRAATSPSACPPPASRSPS